MARRFSSWLVVVVVVLATTIAFAAERKKEEEKKPSEGHSPGGSWSEPTHHGGQNHEYPNQSHAEQGGAKNANRQDAGHQDAAAAGHHESKEQSEKEKDAAAGAAAANRNSPKYSGAEGAAAGAAAVNRRGPQYSGAEGAAAGAAVANRNQPAVSGAAGAAAGAVVAKSNQPTLPAAVGAVAGSAAVQSSFNNYALYGSAWYQANRGVWAPGRLPQGVSVWTPANWNTVAGYCGASDLPAWYDYGKNVTCINGVVAVNGQSVGTPEEFSQQASALAQSGADAQTPADSEWLPLGVFAMVRDEQQHPQMIFQMAINKQGVLRGNYTDDVTEHTQPIHGAADPKTQRVAWTVGDNDTTVMEAGLSNLAEGEAPALIHKGGKTDHWLLVRLSQPPHK